MTNHEILVHSQFFQLFHNTSEYNFLTSHFLLHDDAREAWQRVIPAELQAAPAGRALEFRLQARSLG